MTFRKYQTQFNHPPESGVKPNRGMKKTGIELIAAERQEQIEKHGYSVEKDKLYSNGEFLQAAKFCITLDIKDYPKNWDGWFLLNVGRKRERLSNKDFAIEMAKIGGAFFAAEIDRLQSGKELTIKEETK